MLCYLSSCLVPSQTHTETHTFTSSATLQAMKKVTRAMTIVKAATQRPNISSCGGREGGGGGGRYKNALT